MLRSAVCTLLAAAAVLQVAAAEEPLNVGAAEVDITPPVGFRKAGGYSEVISTGIHDPLMAKALVLRQGDAAAVIIINDLTGVPGPLTMIARKQISERLHVPVANIGIAATHTHGAPEYWGSLRDIAHEAAVANHGEDPHEKLDYQSKVIEAWVDAATLANDACRPSSAEVVVPRQHGIAFNRRFHMRDGTVRFNPGRKNPDILRPAGPVDTDLPFVLFRDAATDQPVSSLTVFAMHTAVWGGVPEFGADFPGVLQKRLRSDFGNDFVSLFGEGTAGDINHFDVSIYDSRAEAQQVADIGNALADTIITNLQHSRKLSSPTLAVRSRTVMAPFDAVDKRRYDDARRILSEQQEDFLTLVAAWRDCHGYVFTQQFPDGKPLEVQVIRLDADTAIVMLPHEVFVEIGMTIKASSPFRDTIVMTLTNGIDFYIPTRRAFEEGSYEVTTCALKPGCGELLSATAIELLNELKR